MRASIGTPPTSSNGLSWPSIRLALPPARTKAATLSGIMRHIATASGRSGRIQKRHLNEQNSLYPIAQIRVGRRACHASSPLVRDRARTAAPITGGVEGGVCTVADRNLASARHGPLRSSDGALFSQSTPSMSALARETCHARCRAESIRRGSAEPSRRANPEPGRNQPDLRLISGDDRADAGSFAPRLAAIVAADMVDYTRHMADDEAGTHARYTALRRISSRRDGTAWRPDHQAHRRWLHGRVLQRHPGGVVRGQVPGRRSGLECSPGARTTPRVSRRHKPGRCDRGGA